MKRLLIGMVLVGGAIAVIAMIVRRRSSQGDQWDSFATDTYGRASDAVSRASDDATEGVSRATDATQGAVSKATDVMKESVTKAADAAQKSASKANEAAKDI